MLCTGQIPCSGISTLMGTTDPAVGRLQSSEHGPLQASGSAPCRRADVPPNTELHHLLLLPSVPNCDMLKEPDPVQFIHTASHGCAVQKEGQNTLLRALVSAMASVRSGRRMRVLPMVLRTSIPPKSQQANWSGNWSTSCAFPPVHLYSCPAADGFDRERP